MGNSVVKDQDQLQQNQTPQDSKSVQKVIEQPRLKTSGTTPDLHYTHHKSFVNVASTSRHQRDHSQLSTLNNSKSKQEVLSAMTSRVLMKEQSNRKSHNLKSFASTQNLHSRSGIYRDELLNNSQQVIRTGSGVAASGGVPNGGDYQYSNAKGQTPFQNISNIVPRNLALNGSPSQDNINIGGGFNSVTGKDQQLMFGKNSQNFSNLQYNTNPANQYRLHSKSAHISNTEQTTNQSCQQSPTGEMNSFNYIDPYKMQQRLLRKLKNSRKNQQTGSTQQQPKQRKPRYDENFNHLDLRNSNSRLNSSQKKMIPQKQISQPIVFFDCNQSVNAGNQFFSNETPSSSVYPSNTKLTNSSTNQYSNMNLLQYQQQQQNPNYFRDQPEQYIERTFKFGDSGDIVPTDIVMNFIKFDPMLFTKLKMLSPSWHTTVSQAIDEYCNTMENQFVQSHIDFLFFKQSYTQSMPIKFCREKGIRLDRVIECEVQPSKSVMNGNVNKTLKLGYQYKIYGSSQVYRADFKLDLVGKGKPRFTWIHQDSINRETYTQPIQQVCIGDSISLSMSLFSLQGFITDLQWDQPQIQETPKHSVFNYNKDWARKLFSDSSIKIYCDLNRICELEDAVVEWYEEAYYQRRTDIYDLKFIKDLFEVKEILYAGVDGAICKAVVIAKKEGTIEKDKLGLQIVIKNQGNEINNEVKRMGYLKDREQPLHVRVGDMLIVYISKSSA